MNIPTAGDAPLQLYDSMPDFTVLTTRGALRFWSWADGQWVVIASHPRDFTAVCSSELAGLARAEPDFAERGVRVLALSMDSLDDHERFASDVEAIYGVSIGFPLAQDLDGSIARLLGMIAPRVSETETVRRTMIVDPLGRIRAILDYPREVGRSVEEILRIIDALQAADSRRIVTPSDWWPGDRVLVPTSMPEDEAERRFGAALRRVRAYLRFVETAEA